MRGMCKGPLSLSTGKVPTPSRRSGLDEITYHDISNRVNGSNGGFRIILPLLTSPVRHRYRDEHRPLIVNDPY